MTDKQDFRKFSFNVKKSILDLCFKSGIQKAHLGGCMSCADIMSVLYFDILKLKNIKDWNFRDRFILSKGHCAIALYSVLYHTGILSEEDITADIRGDSTIIFRHPKRNIEKGIEFSGGSLGLGLGYGTGIAYKFKRDKNNNSKVYVLLGDGECNEGSVWESAAYAGHLNLDNLTVIVDKNNLQQDGFTENILNLNNMKSRWESFGFIALKIDGHSVDEIYKALTMPHNRPLVIIADTIKGKGVSFAENNPDWHDNYLSKTLYDIALAELKEQYKDVYCIQ